MELCAYLLPFAFGLVLGSFFNVLIYRIPRDESIAFPGSHCPHCNKPIKPYNNIPVLSYIILRGKCASCKAHISIQYPIVELLTGMAFTVLTWLVIVPAFDHALSTSRCIVSLITTVFLLILIPLSIIDIKHLILPDAITYPCIAIGIAASFLPSGTMTPWGCVLGMLAGGGSLYAIGKIGGKIMKTKDAMGIGDVKLMCAAGALLGWKYSFMTIAFAAFFGSIAGVGLIMSKILKRGAKMPFGPFLAAGLWLSVLAGKPLWNLYQSLMGFLLAF
jgi:leader peptidase (prepilin peptidase)/N-methyltransferase